MSSQNKFIVIGSLEAAPEPKVTTTGEPFVKFNLISERPSRGDGFPSEKDTIPVVAWQNLADDISNYPPGALVLIEGRILTRSFDDQDGRRKYVTEVEARLAKNLSLQSSASELPIMPEPTSTDPIMPEPVSDTPVPAAALETAPVLEETPAPTANQTPFDLTPASASSPDAALPDKFSKDVEEDIPF